MRNYEELKNGLRIILKRDTDNGNYFFEFTPEFLTDFPKFAGLTKGEAIELMLDAMKNALYFNWENITREVK